MRCAEACWELLCGVEGRAVAREGMLYKSSFERFSIRLMSYL